MTESLSARQQEYENISDLVLMKRVPVVIRLDGRGFAKLTKNLQKPSNEFIHVMANTMLYCVKEMQGAVFGYSYADEITFILKNDQSIDSEPWFQNKVQDIVGASCALATKAFEHASQILEPKLDLIGDALFLGKVFTVPNLSEAANNLILKQNNCLKYAVTSVCNEQLISKLGKKQAGKLLHHKNIEEKKKLLLEHCNIDFEDVYPASFQRGVAVYKTPTLLKDDLIKNKWTLNFDVPIFTQDKDFLFNILLNGHDILRVPRIN